MRNPFLYGKSVTGEFFAGRTEELERVRNLLRFGESAVLCSPDGMGKTSLVAELARKYSKDFNFVYLDLIGIANQGVLIDAFARETMRATFGRIESYPPEAWALLTFPRLRRAVVETLEQEPSRIVGPSPSRTSTDKDEEPGRRRANSSVKMCPECGKPLKWMEKYSRHYCYSCRRYTPIQRILRRTPTKMVQLSDLLCSECGGPLKFVHIYSEHYCVKCDRYPLINVISKAQKKPTTEDIIEALDLPERVANLTSKRVVIALDGFSVFASGQTRDVLETMSERCEMHGNVSYIFVGNNGQVMNRLFQAKSSPFYRFADWLDLSPLPDSTLASFLAERYQSGKGKLSEEAADLIVGASGGYPSYAQRIAHELYDISRFPSLKDVENAVLSVISERSSIYSILWDSIKSPLQRKYLLAAANEPKVPRGKEFVTRHGLKSRSHVQRTEKSLEMRAITNRGEIVDPMFVLWLRSHGAA